MLSVFSFCVFCVWFGVFCVFFSVFLFLGSLFEKIFGSELLFLGVGVGRVCFLCCFAYAFAFLFGFSLPKMSRKHSVDVRSCVSGFFLSSSGFFADVVAFFVFVFSFLREKAQVVTGHTPPHALGLLFPVPFFVPPHLFVRPFWPCVPLLGVFSGCHSGPRAFLGFSWNLRGLSSLAPSEALFWTRGGKGVLVVSFCCFCFPLLLCFAAFFTPTRRGGPVVVRGIPPGRRTRPAPE